MRAFRKILFSNLIQLSFELYEMIGTRKDGGHLLDARDDGECDGYECEWEEELVDEDECHEEWLEDRSEEHTSELQSLMRLSYAGFCLSKKKEHQTRTQQKS